MPTVFAKYFNVMIKTSKSYRIAMLLMFFVLFFVNWLSMRSLLVTEISGDELRGIVLRSLIESLLYVFTCHFFLRTYIESHIVNPVITAKAVIRLLMFVFVVGILYFSLSYMLGKLNIWAITDVDKIQIVNQTGTISKKVDSISLWGIGIFQSFVYLSLWCLIYIFWRLKVQKQKLVNEINESQFQHLTNQLSPHFLFNTLNSIRALIFENPKVAAETVTQLSELLRKQLQSNIQVKSTLEEELKVSRQYLAIEKLRLEERLSVETEVDPLLMSQFLPTLTVLTLVENAIKHGISPNVSPGFIKIEVKKLDDKYWRMQISNSLNVKTKAPSTQIGIKNVKARLQLMYGDNHLFEQTVSNHFFNVSMDIPYV